LNSSRFAPGAAAAAAAIPSSPTAAGNAATATAAAPISIQPVAEISGLFEYVALIASLASRRITLLNPAKREHGARTGWILK